MNTERCLEFYILGFKNEINENILPNNDMLKKAHKLGKKHASEGNNINSLDYLNDDIIAFLIQKEDLEIV